MKANTRFGAGRKRQHGGETCQKLHVNDRVYADFPESTYCSQRTKRESKRAVRRDRYHIFFGNDVHRVENESVVLEYDEINVFASDHVDRTTNSRISENRRALLRKLNEENALNLTGTSPPRGFKD